MRSWYEFGYNGFPTGEQRRRFYRQRDDPCDSEEERDYDDETNDRPIFYYPLRASEEGSHSSYDSAFSSASSSCASDEEGNTGAGDGASCQGGLADCGHRHSKRSRRASREESTTRCVLHSTLYEDMPAWYGATAVALTATPSTTVPATDLFALHYGGAPRASPLSISNQVSLWRWSSTPSSRPSGSSREEAADGLRCTRVCDDATLLSRFRWDRLHPTLRLAYSGAVRPPARIGHCAVGLTTLDSSLLQFFLTDHHSVTATGGATTTSTTTANPPTALHSGVGTGERSTGLLTGDGVEVYGSLIVGGASQLVYGHSSGVSCGRDSGGGAFRDGVGAASGSTSSAVVKEPSLDGTVVPHTCILSHPGLCLTLLCRSEGGDSAEEAGPILRQHTVVFPLDTPSMSVAAPRAFATLTPWADHSAEANVVCSFAYLGGTENGRDPLSFLELEVFRLHLETWTWSCNPVTTYGAKPAPRFGHTANMAHEDKCLLMFGGVGTGHVYLNDLHVLDIRTRVWREVFLPLGLDVPRRAFHMSAIMTNSALISPSHPQLSTFMAQTLAALRRSGAPRSSTGHIGSFYSTDDTLGTDTRKSEAMDAGDTTTINANNNDDDDGDNDDDDVWPSSVTTVRSRCTILFLGGEGDGGSPVTASWSCALRNGKWQQLSFPLRTLPHFFHVARSTWDGDVDTQHVQRKLSRTEFRTAVASLVERTAQTTTTTSAQDSQGDAYVAVCHGSLAQLLRCPRSAHCTERLVMMGGSRGPPVNVATQIEVIGTTLKDRASLWLLAAHQQGCLSAAVQQRVSLILRFFVHTNGALSRAVSSVFRPDGADGVVRERRPLSEADVRSNRLDSESVLDGQLTEWMRLARKRLRDAE